MKQIYVLHCVYYDQIFKLVNIMQLSTLHLRCILLHMHFTLLSSVVFSCHLYLNWHACSNINCIWKEFMCFMSKWIMWPCPWVMFIYSSTQGSYCVLVNTVPHSLAEGSACLRKGMTDLRLCALGPHTVWATQLQDMQPLWQRAPDKTQLMSVHWNVFAIMRAIQSDCF